MPHSGRFAILAAECALAPDSPLFVNGAQVQAAAQTYTGKHVVADGGSVTGTIFNSMERNLIDGCTAIGGAYPQSQSPRSWAQLSARVTPDDLIWIGVESLATGPIYPNTLHPAVETHILNKASNSALYCSADGASEHCLHYRFVEHLDHSRSHCPVGADFKRYEVFSAGDYAHYVYVNEAVHCLYPSSTEASSTVHDLDLPYLHGRTEYT